MQINNQTLTVNDNRMKNSKKPLQNRLELPYLNIHYFCNLFEVNWTKNKRKLFTIHYKTAGFERVRDLKGAVGGASWNERRDESSEMAGTVLSEVQRSTGAKRTPEKPDGVGGIVGRKAGTPKRMNNE